MENSLKYTLSVLPLGVNGLYPEDGKPTSGYLVSTENFKVLVDIGSGVFTKLSEVTEPSSIDAVIVTHYHFDHVCDIGVLSYYLQTKNKKLIVYGPDDNSPFQALIKASPYLDFIPIDETVVDIKGVKINFYKMNHPVLTYGVSFEKDGKKLSYTSDTNLTDSISLLAKESNLLICSTTFLFENWTPDKPNISAYHAGMIGKEFGIKILLSHFKPTVDKQKLLAEAKSSWANVQLAEFIEYFI